jgi:hypothetical protein
VQLESIQIDSDALLGGFLHSEILPAVKLTVSARFSPH